ncbi:exonuclease domain-containing protein [Fusibacter bizertensis]
MKVYFMDLEFLCDEDYAYEDEIIAICLISDDESYELTSLVRPYDDDFEVSEYCTALTGISKDDLSSKPFFSDLYEEMIENTSEDDILYVWGNVDLEAIYKASIEIAGELEFNIVDFQEEFMQYCKIAFRPGLKKVYEILTDDCEIKHHDVRNDTLMLKKIYQLFNADKKAVMRKIKGRMI